MKRRSIHEIRGGGLPTKKTFRFRRPHIHPLRERRRRRRRRRRSLAAQSPTYCGSIGPPSLFPFTQKGSENGSRPHILHFPPYMERFFSAPGYAGMYREGDQTKFSFGRMYESGASAFGLKRVTQKGKIFRPLNFRFPLLSLFSLEKRKFLQFLFLFFVPSISLSSFFDQIAKNRIKNNKKENAKNLFYS